MRKEILFAIIAGGGLGLLIAFGAWKANIFLKNKQIHSTSSPTAFLHNDNNAQENTSITIPAGELKVLISKPENNFVTIKTPFMISGVTKPNAYIVVSGENGDNILNASTSGSFSSDTDLEGGANNVIVSAFDNDGNKTQTNVMLIYSGQFRDPEGTSYIGTVTDKTDTIIQIKNDGGDIQQIKPVSDADFIDTRGNSNKTLKFSDIAIGDFLIAMGHKADKDILESSRILVSDAIKKSTLQIIFGKVTDDKGYNQFIMSDNTNRSFTIKPASGINITGGETSFGGIKNNEKVIMVGSEKDGNIEARSIKVIK